MNKNERGNTMRKKPAITTKRWLSYFLPVIMLCAATVAFTACDSDAGANGSVVFNSRQVDENTFDGGFSISYGSVTRGTRNRTYVLTVEELASIQVSSSSTKGKIVLVISQDGNEDGTEVTQDISNFDGQISADTLSSGDIRFSLRFEGIKDSDTTISWR